MIVSTHTRSASRPASACITLFLPSNVKVLATTAIAYASTSLPRLSMTGPTPAPSPPPTPTTLIFEPRHASASSVRRSFSSRPFGSSKSFMSPPGPAEAGLRPSRVRQCRTPPSEKFLEDSAHRSAHPGEYVHARPRRRHTVPVRVQHHPDGSREHRAADVIGEAAHASRQPPPDRQIEDLLGDFRHPFENRPAAGERDPGLEGLLVAGLAIL